MRLTALLALASALACLPLAQAADGQAWAQEPRAVSATADAGGFTVRSQRDTSLADDALVAAYDARSARLATSLRSEDGDPTTVAAVLALGDVVEFRDGDGDGALGVGDDVVARHTVAGTPAATSVLPLPGGGWQATAVHDLGGAGLLEVLVTARPDPAAGRPPTTLEASLRVLDAATADGTHLAVTAAFEGSRPPDQVGGDHARVLGGGGHAIALAWQDGRGSAQSAGADDGVQFARAQPAGPDARFPATLSATWRPADARSPGGDMWAYLGAAFVGVAAVALPAWRRLRA